MRCAVAMCGHQTPSEREMWMCFSRAVIAQSLNRHCVRKEVAATLSTCLGFWAFSRQRLTNEKFTLLSPIYLKQPCPSTVTYCLSISSSLARWNEKRILQLHSALLVNVLYTHEITIMELNANAISTVPWELSLFAFRVTVFFVNSNFHWIILMTFKWCQRKLIQLKLHQLQKHLY